MFSQLWSVVILRVYRVFPNNKIIAFFKICTNIFEELKTYKIRTKIIGVFRLK